MLSALYHVSVKSVPAARKGVTGSASQKSMPTGAVAAPGAGQENPQQTQTNRPATEAPKPFVAQKRVGRNDPCPCGSGKKYKNCCGKNE